jgi:hypothetical protein
MDSRISLRIVQTLACLALIVLSLVIFISSMTKHTVDAEHATCAAGVLLTKGKMIYRDFACVAQMPYHPFFCAAVFKALNTTHYLFAARMLTVVCNILLIISIIGIFRRVFDSFPVTGWLLGMAMTVLYVFNCHVDEVNGFALNQDFVILCIVVSFWLFVSIDFKRGSQYLRIGAMSALLALATCLHFSAVFIQLLFFIMLMIRREESGKQRFKAVLAFLIAPGIVLTLPAWTMVQAPRAFFINVFEMPMLRMRLIREMQLVMRITFLDKFARILSYLTEPAGVNPFLIVVCLTVLIVLGRRKLELSNLKNAVLAILVPIIFLIIALCSPQVMYEDVAVLIPFVIISFAYPLLYLRKLDKDGGTHELFFIVAAIVVIICTISQVYYQPYILQRASIIFRPQTWIPMKVHQISEEVAQKCKEPKLIVTFAPLYALESGCDIYPELSSGWDGCKIASALSDSKREVTNTLSPKAFKKMLKEKPPSGLVINIDPRKERVSGIGLVLLRTAKTKWPEQDYDKSLWERKAFSYDVVAYFRL